MLKQKPNLIRNVLGFGLVTILLSACSSGEQVISEQPPIEVRTIEVQKPEPIVPALEPLTLRNVEWFIITPNNINEKFEEIKEGEAVFFAVTSKGYENLSLNISDIRAMIEKQKQIIAIYRKQYE